MSDTGYATAVPGTVSLDKKEASDLEGKVQRAAEVAKMINNERDRLSRILISLRGDVPTDAQVEKASESGGTNLLSRLNDSQNEQQMALNNIRHMLDELENLV